jgi:hypothetical protein
MIRYIEYSLTVLASDGHLNGWLAMQVGVFDEGYVTDFLATSDGLALT